KECIPSACGAAPQKVERKSAFGGVFYMAKYRYQFKLMIVKEYLENFLGYGLLAKKHGIPSQPPIERWLRAYKDLDEDGLRRKHSKQVYAVQFKLDVLNFMKHTGASYQDTAIAFKMNNPSVIANWYRFFMNEGIEDLQDKAKGRPPMSKNH